MAAEIVPLNRIVVVEVTYPNTNHWAAIPGRRIKLGRRRLAALSCRDEVLSAIVALGEREGRDVFTVRQVYAEMQSRDTDYAWSTVLKTMQRMKDEPIRPPYERLERIPRKGFRLLERREN
jgi:hypothetical protein